MADFPHGYGLSRHGAMIRDRVRCDAFAEALRQSIEATSVVVDIGTGIGLFAMLACLEGARKVYAIEPTAVIAMARELANVNGVSDRIRFIEDISTRVDLPERADVVVADVRGVLPLYGHSLRTAIDARERLLVPGGKLIPRLDHLCVGVVEAEATYAAILEPWDSGYRGLDLSPIRSYVVNQARRVSLPAENLLGTPARLATIDYMEIGGPNVAGNASLAVSRDGVGHGLALWFETELIEGVGYGTGPDRPETVYGRLFLPWPEPISMRSGDQVDVDLAASLVGANYVWRWRSQTTRRSERLASFDQSSFAADPLEPRQLRKRSNRHVPRLGREGRLHRNALELMDGERDVETIAGILRDRHPDRFPSKGEALAYVGGVSAEWSE